MGEIAENMLNGLLCDTCGVLLDGAEPGYPRRCVSCGGDTQDLDGDELAESMRRHGWEEKTDG